MISPIKRILLGLLIAAPLAGCGGETSTPPETTLPPAPAPAADASKPATKDPVASDRPIVPK